MAYDSTIPSLSNLIGDDIPQMQENFQLLEDSQVVDEGSTSDGDYIRYENGWQMCVSPVYTTPTGGTTGHGSIYRGTGIGEGIIEWTFPQSFTNLLFLSANSDDVDSWANLWERGGSNARIVIWGAKPEDLEEVDLRAFTIGRWK